MNRQIPVIDLFAGPGGLGEGFAAFQDDGDHPFGVALSIEMDRTAHQTLELRAFFRQFGKADVPDEYYNHLRDPQTVTRDELFDRFPLEPAAACEQAWQAKSGRVENRAA